MLADALARYARNTQGIPRSSYTGRDSAITVLTVGVLPPANKGDAIRTLNTEVTEDSTRDTHISVRYYGSLLTPDGTTLPSLQ